MERRALLAIALSVGILLVWQAFFAPAPPTSPRGPAGPTGSAPVITPAPESGAIALAPRPQASGGEVGAGLEVSTPLYRATFGADGAVTAWTLHYRGVKPLVIGEGPGPLTVGLAEPGGAIEMIPLRPERSELALTAGAGTVVFRGVTRGGVGVRKTLEFRADSYLVGVQLDMEAGARVTGPATLALYWTSPVTQGGPSAAVPKVTLGEGPGHAQLLGRILVAPDGGEPIVFEAPAAAVKDSKEVSGATELKDPRLVPAAFERATRGWAALENDYFIASLIGGGGRLFRARDRDVSEVALVFPDVRLEPGGTWTARGRAYVGPKEWERLKAAGAGLEEAQARNYGHFLWLPWVPMWWFCVPLLWLLNFFGTQVPGQNYGVAIIMLTVLVKGLFYPLSHKSMSSMKQMQALQPQLNALRAKYKSDPQRFQREQMALFRTHKVNPMGGCLPMVVQIPIFYALYLTLQYSVELQGAHFLLWITDLSKKDPYYVLPILMGVSMLVQQKMTPTVGDPRQARVMLIMPVIFTFMFLEFPTGLVLYWLVNNVLSVTQQALIDRAIRARARPAVVEAKGERPAR